MSGHWSGFGQWKWVTCPAVATTIILAVIDLVSVQPSLTVDTLGDSPYLRRSQRSNPQSPSRPKPIGLQVDTEYGSLDASVHWDDVDGAGSSTMDSDGRIELARYGWSCRLSRRAWDVGVGAFSFDHCPTLGLFPAIHPSTRQQFSDSF